MLIGRAEVANRVATNLLARCAREELERTVGERLEHLKKEKKTTYVIYAMQLRLRTHRGCLVKTQSIYRYVFKANARTGEPAEAIFVLAYQSLVIFLLT